MDKFSPSDPLVQVFMKINEQWVMIGETEKIENDANPSFAKLLELDYHFERQQPMKFECYDVDGSGSSRQLSLIGTSEFLLANVMGAP